MWGREKDLFVSTCCTPVVGVITGWRREGHLNTMTTSHQQITNNRYWQMGDGEATLKSKKKVSEGSAFVGSSLGEHQVRVITQRKREGKNGGGGWHINFCTLLPTHSLTQMQLP